MNFFSDLSLWWLVLFALLAGGLSYFYYFRSVQKTTWEKKELRVLFLLRSGGLFLALLLLLGLVWESITYRQEKPLFVTLVDNSSSMLNYKDSAKISKQISAFEEQLEERFGDKFELKVLTVGEKVGAEGKYIFKEKQTNLAEGFDHLHNVYFNRNLGGVVLISDGNFNDGAHPMYSADRLQLTPIFTLGVGDTVTRKDIAVRSVLTNEVAFLNNSFPIEVLVDLHKMPTEPVVVQLMNNGKVIDRQTVRASNSSFDQQRVLFTVEAKNKGFQRYTVSVERKKGEFTYENNAQSCYIEIVDTKSRILLLADAPHPDLAALRSVFELDKRAVIETDYTGGYTLKGITPSLVVWYENGSKPNPGLFQQFREKGIPVWLIVGPTTPSSVLQQMGLSIRTTSGNQQDDVYPTVSKGFTSFEFTQTCTDLLKITPPLRAKFGAVTVPNDAEVLLNQRVGTVAKKDPLFVILNGSKSKVGVMLGEGIWRWKMKEFMLSRNTEGFDEFVNKVSLYLTLKQNTEPFRVTFPKRFTVAEEVEVKAEFYNESMELITTPEIQLTVKKATGKTEKVAFSPVSNFYKASLGQLSAGTYQWTAKASYKGKAYTKSGSFVVEDIAIEQLSNRSDFSVLTQLSKQSDGSFHELKNADKLLKELETRSDIAVVQYADSGYTSLIDWWWFFALLILIFGAEWFLRRRWGSY